MSLLVETKANREDFQKSMKKKFSRILGVGLTIAMLASLLVVGAPASASTLSWGYDASMNNLQDGVDFSLAEIGYWTDIVDVAASGDTIYVAASVYDESIVLEVTEVTSDNSTKVTVTYTDQDGNTGATTTGILLTSQSVGDGISLSLESGDTAVRDVTNVTDNRTADSAGAVKVNGGVSETLLGTYDATTTGTFTDSTAANPGFYKSTDGGATWVDLKTSTSFPSGVTVKAIAVAPDDVDTVAVITSTNEVEYSTNGGSSWTDLDKPSDTSPAVTAGTLLDIDIASGGAKIAVSGNNTAGAAELFTRSLTMTGTWQARYTSGTGIAASQDTLAAVKYSPNYSVENVITVISSDTSANTSTFQVFRETSGAYTWNGQIAFFDTDAWGTGIALTDVTIAGGIGAADIALFSTYLGNDSGERVLFASVAGATSGGGVFRLTDSVVAKLDRWDDGQPGAVGSIAYHESGNKLLGGDYDNNQVYTWATPTSGTSNAGRINALKQPGGENKTVVAWAGDNAVAGTSGDESAFAVSTDDGYAFNDISLIDTDIDAVTDVSVNADSSKIYMTTHDNSEGTGDYDASVWVKDGTWNRVFSSVNIADAAAPFLVRIAPDDDGAVYISSKSTANMWVSKDSGKTLWKAVPVYKLTAVQDFAVESADVVYAIESGAAGGVSKTSNAGASWGTDKEPVKAFAPYMITLAPNNDILVGGSAGFVSFSTDSGSTFTRTKVVSAGANVHVVADDDYAENGIAYAAAGTTVKRATLAADATWATRAPTVTTGHSVTGIARDGDIIYVLTSDGTNSDLHRALNLQNAAASSQEPLAMWSLKTDTEDLNQTPQALKVASGTKLWAVDTGAERIVNFTDDIAVAGPTPQSPADEATIPVNPESGQAYDVTFTWERQNSKVSAVDLEIATDMDFDALVYQNEFTGITSSVKAVVVGPTQSTPNAASFMPGTTYYWRVRTSATGPVLSPWSEIYSFAVDSIGVVEEVVVSAKAVSLQSPALGSVDVPIMPTFVWTEMDDAIRYEIAVSELADFSILDWSTTEDGIFYKTETALAYGTTYYWRVRGVTDEPPAKRKAAIGGPWEVGIFTTESKAVASEPTIITVTEPAPPAPAPEVKVVEVPVPAAPAAIPSFLLWTIIVIGAVLIIALIVLIVRTRRVA